VKKIYEYPLYLTSGTQHISMSVGAEIVHFAMQGDRPCMWARVNPYAAVHQRKFWIHGTGFEIPDSHTYIGTTQHGDFAWHLFEEKQ